MSDIVFHRGDLVWVIDPEPDRSRHRLGIVMAIEEKDSALLVFQGDGLWVSVPFKECIPVPLADEPGAAAHNFAEVLAYPTTFAAIRAIRDIEPR